MNVLLITEEYPYPPDSGAKIRIWHLLAGLARAHNVTVAAFGEGPCELPLDGFVADRITSYTCTPPLMPDYKKGLNVLSAVPLGVWRRDSQCLRQLVNEIVATHDFHVILVEEVWMAPYAVGGLAPCLIIDKLNLEFVRSYRRLEALSNWTSPVTWARWLGYKLIAARLRRYEMKVLQRFDRVLVCSDHDARLLREMAPYLSVDVVPNGVDIEYFSPNRQREEVNNRIVFIGTFSYEPNTDAVLYFVRSILPLIKEEVPDVTFFVVGSDPPPRVRRLSANPEIVVTGYVTDIRPFVERAQVVAVPLRIGSGTRLKILQALALGKPVVSTTVGAEGLDVEPGVHLLLADSAPAFAHASVQLLKDRTLGQELGRRGRELVRARYAWQQSQRKLLEVFDTVDPSQR